MKKDVVLTSNTLDRDNVFFMQLFYRYALRCCSARWPSSVCFAATFPLGEGIGGALHLPVGQHVAVFDEILDAGVDGREQDDPDAHQAQGGGVGQQEHEADADHGGGRL